MTAYEVSWIIEVDADSPEDAAGFVDDQYLIPCESGDWVYEVKDRESNEKIWVAVHEGVGEKYDSRTA